MAEVWMELRMHLGYSIHTFAQRLLMVATHLRVGKEKGKSQARNQLPPLPSLSNLELRMHQAVYSQICTFKSQ
jgi:hypothetical protein